MKPADKIRERETRIKRWKAVITYDDGKSKEVNIEELEELHDIIEGGPDWNLINDVKITYNLKEK